MMARRGRGVVAGALCALILAAPAPVAARVTVTVQIAYGAVVVGGVGLFVAVGGSWELPFANRDLPTALLEIGDGNFRPGIPLPSLSGGYDPAAADHSVPGVRIDLLRWRF